MTKRRLTVLTLGWMLSAALAMPGQSAPDAPGSHWVAAWTASPDSADAPLKAGTIRQIVRVSLGGSAIRLRLSNLFGTGPLTLGPVHVARRASGSSIQPGTDHTVTFKGQPTLTLPKGESALSDPIPMAVPALQELAVSLYLPTDTGPSTVHGLGNQTAYLTEAGDATAAIAFPLGHTDDSRFFLTDVDVLGGPQAQALVAFGDSITDGAGSTLDQNARWPDALAARLQADPAGATLAVVNAGIAGNRILNDGASPFIGPSGLSRFDRDALSKPGVRWILLLAGGNDVSASDMLSAPKERVSAAQIIEGMKALIGRAHAKGLRIGGATLLPNAGVQKPFIRTEAGAAKRQAINAWIRSSGAFDAVVDFEQVMRDPAHPDRLLPAYDSGDHLHPNDAGYRAMAAAIDLSALTQKP